MGQPHPGHMDARKPRLRVVHVSSAHSWTDNRIHLREAASLVSGGFEVHLVAVEAAGAVSSTGVVLHLIRRRGRAARVTIGVVHALGTALKINGQIYHLHDPELIPLIPVLRLMRRVVIYDAHEDLEAQVRDKQYLPAWTIPYARILARLLVRLANRWSTHVVAATEAIAERFSANHLTVVRNYARLRPEDSEAPSLGERERRAVYVGAVSKQRGVLEMVDAAAYFPDGWSLAIAGSMDPPSLGKELDGRPGWSRVENLGQLSPSAARDLLVRSRVGIVTLHRTVAYLDSLPTKMFEYMGAGIPMIASDFPLWRSIIDRYDCGLLVNEERACEIADGVHFYAANPQVAQMHGNNARRAAIEVFNWEVEAEALVDLYDKLSLQFRVPRNTRQPTHGAHAGPKQVPK
jgi:glycosyltransferase involved in cell wall biosynthesis